MYILIAVIAIIIFICIINSYTQKQKEIKQLIIYEVPDTTLLLKKKPLVPQLSLQDKIKKITTENLSCLEFEENIKFSKYEDPTYKISDISVKGISAQISIERVIRYATIDRYEQRNYVRTPIYSNWKLNFKTFTKHCTLDNKSLEELSRHDDPFISAFSAEIIYRTMDQSNYPYWLKFKLEYVDYAYKRTLYEDLINNNRSTMSKENRKIAFKVEEIKKHTDKLSKKKSKKAQGYFTLLTKKSNECKSIIENAVKTCNLYEEYLKVDIDNLHKQYQASVKNIKSLTTNIPDKTFVPIAKLNTYENSVIKGIYIIQNTENQRVYVGQSKDILRRLKQHFQGTVPKNHIFFEDYYTAKNKDNLFSVKIIPLETKDELDFAEKEYIQKYDAFNSGYNGTQGNK